MKVTKYILEIDIEEGSSNRNIKIDDILNDSIPGSIESSTPFSIFDTITINDVLYNIDEISLPNYKTVNNGIEVVTKITISGKVEGISEDGWYVNNGYYYDDDELCPF